MFRVRSYLPAMTDDMGIRPFRIDIPQADIDELEQRLQRTRRAPDTPGSGWSRGVPADHLSGLAEYWASDFDWRTHEAELNAWPQFVTDIDGQRIHFIHVRSKEPDATPLLLSHGYPSSVVEFLDVIGPLTDPRAFGADPRDAFDVVVPSLPGFGWSTPLSDAGWTMARTARAWVELMRRLGYDRFGGHGGDIGSGITGMLSGVAPDAVIGAHIVSDPRSTAAVVGEFVPVDLDALAADDRERLQALKADVAEGMGYLKLQSTHPQTVAYALADSPTFQLAWIAEPFHEWTETRADRPDGVDRDRLLTNVSVYWFTRSGSSAAHVLYENAHSHDWIQDGPAPTGWAVFGADPLVRQLMDPKHAIEHWSEYQRGGHFPALEVPELLVEDIRDFFRSHR
jgi:pimeloyl-ACP methyl ester carboxylesterase